MGGPYSPYGGSFFGFDPPPSPFQKNLQAPMTIRTKVRNFHLGIDNEIMNTRFAITISLIHNII